MNLFKSLLNAENLPPPIGTWIMSASPLIAEAMGHAGFQWGVIDMEHTPLDLENLLHMLQAVAGTSLVPIVRVPWNDTVNIKRVLDTGATTLLVPFVQNAQEAQAAVSATRYPPQGRRGMAGMSRASRFGTTQDYLRCANEHMGVIVQLETPQAIEALESIASVSGVDALFIGPGDLSATMGHVGQVTHPDVLALTEQAVRRAKALGMPIGTVGGTPEVVSQYLGMGFDFVAIASDLGLLMRSAQGALAALKGSESNVPKRLNGGY
jgi:2-keto-3-deoxy-L-rhamnonate aldolase RhmA